MQRMSDCQVAVQHSDLEGQGTGIGKEDRICENTIDDVALSPTTQVTGGDEHMKYNVGQI